MSETNLSDQGLAAQERGERVETSKHIARGGKQIGHVPGAEPQLGVKPKALTNDSDDASEKTKAVYQAMTELGDEADPKELAEHVRISAGIDLSVGQIAAIKAEILKGLAVPTTP